MVTDILYLIERMIGYMAFLEVKNLTRIYGKKENQLTALDHVSFSVERGEFVAVTGASGSGKSTLLHLLGTMDDAQDGSVKLEGEDVLGMKEKQKAVFRRRRIGFVFQEFNLLDTFTVEDNIYLPLVLAGEKYDSMHARLVPLADKLGITSLLQKYPYEISGGQKQRVALARAVITNPKLVLADEPTGALDSRATDELLRLFAQINHQGQTVLMVTHSVRAASTAGRVLFIKDGEVFHQIFRGRATDQVFYQKIADTLTLLATGGMQA